MLSIAGEYQVSEVLVLCDQDGISSMRDIKNMFIGRAKVRVADVPNSVACRGQRLDDMPIHTFISDEIHSSRSGYRRIDDVVVDRINGEKLSGLDAIFR